MGYRIVRKKFCKGLLVLSSEAIIQVVKTLFPRHPATAYDEVAATEIPLFTIEEQEEAKRRMNIRRSPGPDGMPSDLKAEWF